MNNIFLEFEKPLADIESKIEQLRNVQSGSAINISNEIDLLQKKSEKLAINIYSKLTPEQIVLIARHPQRPYTLDYIKNIFTDFHELHGDRMYADDQAIIGGLAKFDGMSCMVIGNQKGRDIKERSLRNFGMPRPEGYRKVLRLMKLAEKFNIAIFTFIDTPGDYPGIDAEERCQSEAIGHNLYTMSKLRVPIISTVIGEGGSGSSLAIAAGNIVLMLQYAIYSVILQEECTVTLDKKKDKIKNLYIASTLKELSLINNIVNEPIGGAHKDPIVMYKLLHTSLSDSLRLLKHMTPEQLVEQRIELFLSYGDCFKNK